MKTYDPSVKNEQPALTADLTLRKIVAVLKNALAATSCTVYWFGSRVGGNCHDTSDYDIGVLAKVDIAALLSQAKEELENSDIPYKVDLVDLHDTSEIFRCAAMNEGIILWKN